MNPSTNQTISRSDQSSIDRSTYQPNKQTTMHPTTQLFHQSHRLPISKTKTLGRWWKASSPWMSTETSSRTRRELPTSPSRACRAPPVSTHDTDAKNETRALPLLRTSVPVVIYRMAFYSTTSALLPSFTPFALYGLPTLPALSICFTYRNKSNHHSILYEVACSHIVVFFFLFYRKWLNRTCCAKKNPVESFFF